MKFPVLCVILVVYSAGANQGDRCLHFVCGLVECLLVDSISAIFSTCGQTVTEKWGSFDSAEGRCTETD